MDQKQAVSGIFDRVADTYDQVGVDFFGPIARRLVGELDPRPGERALDVGCGRGAVLFELARAVGPAARPTGIDLSPRMVAAVAADADAAGLPVDVRVADAESPPFDPGSFDLVTSSLVLFFLPDPAEALRAWRVLLVPGGRLGVSTFGEFSSRWKAVDAVFGRYVPPQLRDARTTGRTGPFASDAGVEGLLRNAGFDDVRTVTADIAVQFDDPDHWYRWSWSVGQRAMWEAVPEDQRETVRAAAYDVLQSQRDDDGQIGFEQRVRFTLGRR